MLVMVVVVWTVSWPRRERCPGTQRVTSPRPPRRSFFFLSSASPPYLFSYMTCSPFLCLYSLFLFSLCTSRSSSRPRSRVHSTADFPVPGDPSAPVNQCGGGPVSAFLRRRAGEETRGKKAHSEEFAFCALESELFAVFPDV